MKTVPHITCTCGKRGFEDEHDAEKALGRARAKRQRHFDKSGSRRGMKIESRSYACPDSGLLHLTEQSRRSFDVYSGAVAA